MTIDAAFTRFPSLTTNRLLLRQIQPEDAEALFATFSDAEVMEFYGHEPHQSLDETYAWIQQIQARYHRRETTLGYHAHRQRYSHRLVRFPSFQPWLSSRRNGLRTQSHFLGQGHNV